ncbi:MAG: DNA polymerase III subunit gamma/tau, partial [Oscillospiraceae bacterium]|nr:DNA polymerase III subunit gamma/tau [Oscillospiraceae bacterium]
MMYQALYRKYRPQTFDDVSGQMAVTQTLKTQLSTGHLSHAYLFTGSRGTGKTSCAKILAKAVNCEALVDGNPCNRCSACRSIDSGACMDVLEIDAASNNGVDNVRDLRDDAIYSPSQVKMRVYIIDEVHMLSISAFNALLKIIEEPPEHLLFILATTELHKVPATILSRCQRFSFRRISQEDIAARLQYVAYQEDIDLDDSAARVLARLADGGMRDGLSLLDQCASATVGALDAERVYSCLGIAGEQKCAELMSLIA